MNYDPAQALKSSRAIWKKFENVRYLSVLILNFRYSKNTIWRSTRFLNKKGIKNKWVSTRASYTDLLKVIHNLTI